MAPHWRAAAGHFDSDGLQDGVEVFSLRRLLDQLSSAQPGGPRLAGLLLTISIGGMWTRARQGLLKAGGARHEGTQVDPTLLCPRCHEAAEDSLHRAWLCPHNTGSPIFEASNGLVPSATSQSEPHACFWLRGMIPSTWTATPLPILSDGWESFGVDHPVGPGCITPNPDGSEL
eukprot:2057434-Pyramimonas_sp.AAC.1